MPFLSIFYRSLHTSDGSLSSRRKAIPIKKNTVIRTARPRIHNNQEITEAAEKKACSAFFQCSMTIEAALALPLFVFAVCILIFPLKIIDAELRYQAELEDMTRNIASCRYLEKTSGELLGENICEYSGMVTGMVTAADICSSADKEVLHSVIPLEVRMPSDEDETVKLTVLTSVVFPFTKALDINGITVAFVSQRRAWVGREGGAGRAYGDKESSAAQEAGPDDLTVWVARNASESGRYHLSSECHYIANTVTAVPVSSVASLRSANGGKYVPCSACRPGTEGIVFIFRSGGSYHASENCRSIMSYAVETTKKEAEERGLTPCSYCLTHYR